MLSSSTPWDKTRPLEKEKTTRKVTKAALLCLCKVIVLFFFVAWVFWLLKGAIYQWFLKKGLGNRRGPWGWFKRFWANQGINKFPFNYTHNGKRHKRVSQGLRQILSNGERYNNSGKLKTKSMVNTGSFWGPESGKQSSTLKFKVLSLSERKFCLCRSCVVCKLNGKRKENTFTFRTVVLKRKSPVSYVIYHSSVSAITHKNLSRLLLN